MTAPTDATRQANTTLYDRSPFDDTTDFDLAERGYIAPLPGAVTMTNGRPVWDSHRFDFVAGVTPDTVDPSQWRQEQVSGQGGLFEVVDGTRSAASTCRTSASSGVRQVGLLSTR